MNRYWILGTALAVVALVAMSWFLGVQPKLQEAASADAERLNVEAQNLSYEVTLADLRKKFENIDELRAEVADLRTAVPAEADYSGFVNEVNALAAQTAVEVTHITINQASWYTSTPTEAPATEDAPADGAATPETPVAAAPPVTVPVSSELVNGSNFVAIPVKMQLAGDSANYLSLISALQSGPRLFLVTGFGWGADAPASVSGLLYVLIPGAQ